MNDQTDDRPMETIRETWRQYKSWAATAKAGKSKQDSARNLTLILGLLGAASATATNLDEALLQSIFLSKFWLSILCSLLIAVAAFLGKELLTPERETIWARCRMVAEAVQRQAWLALMRVPPYDKDDAAQLLAKMTQQLVQGEKLTKATRTPTDLELRFPAVETVDDYIEQRVQGQINWYRERAKWHHSRLAVWRGVSLTLGIAAILLGGFGAYNSALSVWVPVVTSMSAAVLALVQAGRLQAIPPLYQQTADQLAIQLALWRDGAGKTLSSAEFVSACEDIMAHENESWRTEWLSKEAMEKTREAYDRAQASLPRSVKDTTATQSTK